MCSDAFNESRDTSKLMIHQAFTTEKFLFDFQIAKGMIHVK
jgi:hypothetical protein